MADICVDINNMYVRFNLDHARLNLNLIRNERISFVFDGRNYSESDSRRSQAFKNAICFRPSDNRKGMSLRVFCNGCVAVVGATSFTQARDIAAAFADALSSHNVSRVHIRASSAKIILVNSRYSLGHLVELGDVAQRMASDADFMRTVNDLQKVSALVITPTESVRMTVFPSGAVLLSSTDVRAIQHAVRKLVELLA